MYSKMVSPSLDVNKKMLVNSEIVNVSRKVYKNKPYD